MAKKPAKTPRRVTGKQGLIARVARDLAVGVRAGNGFANALLVLYEAKLRDAETEYQRLGNLPSADAGRDYQRQECRTQELRGLVAILTAMDAALADAVRKVARVEELSQPWWGSEQ